MENKAIETVETYHKRYLEFENAFEGEADDEKKISEELETIVKNAKDFEDEKFKDAVVELTINKVLKRTDVTNAALRFYMSVDFYNTLGLDPLPEQIQKDYNNLPIRQQIKTYHSIEKGKFVRNVNEDPQIEKEQFKQYFDALQQQYE